MHDFLIHCQAALLNLQLVKESNRTHSSMWIQPWSEHMIWTLRFLFSLVFWLQGLLDEPYWHHECILSGVYLYHPQMKLREGNVFTSVCLSFCSGEVEGFPCKHYPWSIGTWFPPHTRHWNNHLPFPRILDMGPRLLPSPTRYQTWDLPLHPPRSKY